MAAAETYAPWFKPLFVAIWAMTMAYLWTLIFVVVRLRRREGALRDGGIEDWVKVVFDPAFGPNLRWIFSDRHRAFDDAVMTGVVYLVRVLFVICAAAMATFAALLPWRIHRVEAPNASLHGGVR